MVEVYRTIDERRSELRKTVEELRPLVEAEKAAHGAIREAEKAWQEAKKAATEVRNRRNALIRGLADDIAAGRVKQAEIAADAGVVHQQVQRLLGDKQPRSDSSR
jgi:seryl-tRNA synthetase